MDDKQEIAFLKAKVEVLEKAQERMEKRQDKFEESINEKLDLLILKSKYQEGILKALIVIGPILVTIMPIVIKMTPFLQTLIH